MAPHSSPVGEGVGVTRAVIQLKIVGLIPLPLQQVL